MTTPLHQQKTEDRAHAVLSASGFKVWSTCTMSAALQDWLPEENSPWSREGTYGHELFEAHIRVFLGGNDGGDIAWVQELTDPERTPEAGEFYTEDFAQAVDQAVAFAVDRITALRAQHGDANVTVLLEQRLDFSRWVPEGFGRGDLVIIYPGGIEVLDLKMGQGVYVDGENNGQIRLYGLGAYQRYNGLYDFDEVTVTILQPRKDNYSGEVLSVDDLLGLMHWADELVKPRAAIAWRAYETRRRAEAAGATPERVRGALAETGAAFSPGPHCSEGFCKARFTCAARARYVLEMAEQPHSLADPTLLSIQQLEAAVDRADVAVKWLADVKRHLTAEAAAGKVKLDRYAVVPGRSARKITDHAAAAQVLMSEGFAAGSIYHEPVLRGIVELEKLVGKTKFAELLADYLDKPVGDPVLVLKENLKAPRSKTKATDDFGGLDDE